MMNSAILLNDTKMGEFAQAVADELPVFKLYSTPEAFAKRWLGGCFPDGCAELGIYVVLIHRRKIRLFHAGETDEGTVGWIREITDPLEMGGNVIGHIDSLDARTVAKTVMDHFLADPDAGTELAPGECLRFSE
ncbi:MAG: hypothetical protein KAI66_26955 [Lentisphaeria bacterium]|nr:hypothetical protein [Lentisphaeria bacterium]